MTPEEKAQHDALITEIKTTAKNEIESRGFQNKEDVKSILDTMMANMPLDALRKYNDDKTQQETNIRNIAAEVEKIKTRSAISADHKTNVILEAMNSKMPGEEKTQWEKIELAMRSKHHRRGEEIVNLNIRAAADMTLGNTVDASTHSVPVTIVESMSMADFAPKRYGVQFINQIADRTVVQEITQYKTWLEEGNEQGSFAVVSEGAVKPLVSDGLVRNFSQAKKVAGKYVITEEFVKFRQNAYNILRTIINDKMIRDYTAILVTDLNSFASTYTGTALDGTFTGTNVPTDYDAIAAAAAQIESLNFNPDVIILHPQDKWRIITEKNAQGSYYAMIPVIDVNGVTKFMGFNVVTSTYQTLGQFTIAESNLFKIEEEPISLRMGYGIDVTTTTVSSTTVVSSVISDFDSNKMRMIVEVWFNDWLPTPYIGAVLKASFATIKTGLA